jgi:Chaperone of endosialidase
VFPNTTNQFFYQETTVSSYRSKITLSVLTALAAAAAGATQPTDSVTSDPSGNTAMGQLALALLDTPNCSSSVACYNTAAGAGSLYSNAGGSDNSAFGFQTLNSNGSGAANSAMGYRALLKNQGGSNNSAFGANALLKNTSSKDNSAFGANALLANATGAENSAFGVGSLYSNESGSYNVAFGNYAAYYNSSGDANTAVGYQALQDNGDGSDNTAVGSYALFSHQTGANNTAIGANALYNDLLGNQNIAIGVNALSANVGGSANIAIGYAAGVQIRESSNIDIGNLGSSADVGVIRIGTSGAQTQTYISGIENSKITGNAVYVTSSGQLGVLASSERYKDRIETMGEKTDKLQLLRPVTFHLKSEPKGEVQYGLIAEEVAKVYPELVIRDDTGKIQGVRYDELAPMLLNEMQKQQRRIASQEETVARLIKANESLQAAVAGLIGKDQRVAMGN